MIFQNDKNETRKMHKNKNGKLWKKEKTMQYQKIELKYHKILTIINANGCTKQCKQKQERAKKYRVKETQGRFKSE